MRTVVRAIYDELEYYKFKFPYLGSIATAMNDVRSFNYESFKKKDLLTAKEHIQKNKKHLSYYDVLKYNEYPQTTIELIKKGNCIFTDDDKKVLLDAYKNNESWIYSGSHLNITAPRHIKDFLTYWKYKTETNFVALANSFKQANELSPYDIIISNINEKIIVADNSKERYYNNLSDNMIFARYDVQFERSINDKKETVEQYQNTIKTYEPYKNFSVERHKFSEKMMLSLVECMDENPKVRDWILDYKGTGIFTPPPEELINFPKFDECGVNGSQFNWAVNTMQFILMNGWKYYMSVKLYNMGLGNRYINKTDLNIFKNKSIF